MCAGKSDDASERARLDEWLGGRTERRLRRWLRGTGNADERERGTRDIDARESSYGGEEPALEPRLARGPPTSMRARILRANGSPPPSAPRARDADELAGEFTRPFAAEDGILVFRERFDDGGWPESQGPELFGSARTPAALFTELRGAGRDPASLAFVDIETCGLGDAPIFLVGILRAIEESLELVQFFSPDASREPALLRRAADLLSARGGWVSFNGRSFDVPRLGARARRHGIAWPRVEEHVDLLHAVRRKFGRGLPDCRLGTVERRVLGIERAPGDVPGREVPNRYYDFVETGKARWLEPVIEHNRRDVAALAVLFVRLLEPS